MLHYKLHINTGYLHATTKLTIARRRNESREKQTRFMMGFGIIYVL